MGKSTDAQRRAQSGVSAVSKVRRARAEQAESRLPSIFRSGFRVFTPEGRRKDGEWSRRLRIEAAFLSEREAKEYAARAKANRPGMPVVVVSVS